MQEALQSLLAIDPVLVQLGPLAIRWYALAYIAGIIGGYYYIKRINQHNTPPLLKEKALDDLILYAVLGIIAGGRIGYVLFYNAPYFLDNPEEIIAIWKGGMSFHGGLIGVTLAFYLFAKRFEVNFFALMDRIACAAPIGLFFGRLANFINGELYGRVTHSEWGLVFPHGGSLPRHPSQLYEAGLEGLVLFVLLAVLWHYTKLRRKPGMLAGIFLIGYATARSIVEFFREPDAQLGFLWGGATMGQLLCVPMAALGVYLVVRATNRECKAARGT